jgi:hypothetical protein
MADLIDYTQDTIKQTQSDVLTGNLKINELMKPSPILPLNKALKGTQQNVVNAINEVLSKSNTTDTKFINFADFYNKILLDINTLDGQDKYSKMLDIGVTVIEAIIELSKKDVNVSTYTAGLGGLITAQVVFITSINTVSVADCNNVYCSNRVIGLAINTALQGESVFIKSKGKIINPLWVGNFVTGDIVYCGNSGEITKTPNLNSKFIQKIGVFTNDNGELLIDIAESVELE